MSAYKVGLALATSEIDIVGATAPQKQKSSADIFVVLGILGFIFVAIPGKKGWQRALGDGK